MNTYDARELAAVLNQKDNDPTGALKLRRGVVTVVGATTATVTVGGVGLAGIPFYRGMTLGVGDVVDLLFDGPAPRIIGVVA